MLDQKGAALDRATIEGRLGAHLCRCTGYAPIIRAAMEAAATLREGSAHA